MIITVCEKGTSGLKNSSRIIKHHKAGAIFWVILLLAILGVARKPIFEILQLLRDRQALIATLQGYGFWTPLLLSLVITLQVIIAAIPGHLLFVAGGYIYGFTGGFLFAWINTVIASQITFSLARNYGKPLVDRVTAGADVTHWLRVAERHGFTFFLTAFMVPIFPADLMTYVAGLSSIAPKKFLAANMLGRIPAAVVLTLVGSHGLILSPKILMIATAISLTMVIVFHRKAIQMEARYLSDTQHGKQD